MKDITVTLDASEHNDQRLDAAVDLADKFNAHLTGIYYERVIDYSLYGDSISGILIEGLSKQQDLEKSAMKSRFDTRTTHRQSKTSYRVESRPTSDSVSVHARLSDLVVTGQRNPDSHFIDPNTEPEHLIMGTGRPVLVIPYIGYPARMGETVIVAWDQSRESARAIADALPLLKAAKQVHVFQVVKRSVKDSEMVTADMAEHLARHDINVNTQATVRNEVPVAETMLSKVSDLGADLIVMGAYGHSRLREYTLGGVTRTMLQSMTVPVLMTH